MEPWKKNESKNSHWINAYRRVGKRRRKNEEEELVHVLEKWTISRIFSFLKDGVRAGWAIALSNLHTAAFYFLRKHCY